MEKKVIVLMSTYNGSKYLSEQIDTILNQKDVSVELCIRDDGSKDNTWNILQQYAKEHDNVKIYRDEPLGVGRSFMTLLKNAGEADYYAFADQDDIWHSDKMKSAVDMLEKQNSEKPLLYCCNQNCVNMDGAFLDKRFPDNYQVPGLVSTVLTNYFAGCTMVMNQALKDYITSSDRMPELDFFRLRIHDAWIACVANTVGRVVYDPEAHMDFRRHENAFSDAFVPQKKTSHVKRYIAKLRRLFKRNLQKNNIQKTAENLMANYADFLSGTDESCIRQIANYNRNLFTRLRFAFSAVVFHYVAADKPITMMKILIGIL